MAGAGRSFWFGAEQERGELEWPVAVFGNPVVTRPIVFAAIIGISEWLEKTIAQQAREDFVRFLRTTNFADVALRLPPKTLEVFEGVFGPKHLSLPCMRASFLVSSVSICLLFVIAALLDPNYAETLGYELSGAEWYRPYLVSTMTLDSMGHIR
jgi:hypothetical protein